MYVLTFTTGSYSDAETHVVGVFDTNDAMVAAKEAHRGLSGDWDAWVVPDVNTFYGPGTLENEVVLTQREVDAIAENTRQQNLGRRQVEEAEQRRAECAERARVEFSANIRSRCSLTLSPAAPIEVLEHLMDLSADTEVALKGIASSDPWNKLPALQRRFGWYARQSAEMRGKLVVLGDAEDLAAFDRITAASNAALHLA